MSKTITARECRFAIHIRAKHGLHPDLHLIKEQISYSDGSIEPNVRLIEDFQRPFWVTTPSKRNHKQKKEYEELENLNEYHCNDSELRDRVAVALEQSYSQSQLAQLAISPYLYGTDITASALIKKRYLDKYTIRTPYSVAVFDIETKQSGKDTIITLASIAFKNKIYTGILSSLVKGIANVPMALKLAMHKYLPNYRDQLIEEIEVCNTEVDIIRGIFKRAHEWSPDILTAWNINYDIPKILAMLERHRVDPRDILCHPKLAKSARICKYKEGKKKKITSSGNVTPISPASQWHTLYLTAGFYVLDAMCVYKLLRIAKPEEPSYKLDAILEKELGSHKLSFTEADNYQGIRWHNFMQEQYPIEYIVYNRYDCLSILELDAKTKDLSHTIAEFAGVTDFKKFNSQPKRIADALYFYLLANNKVIGCVGFEDRDKQSSDYDYEYDLPNITEEEEDDGNSADTLGLEDWIITLSSSLQVHGLPMIAEDPSLHTNLRAQVYDVDVTAAYPTCTEVCNVSKETTNTEIIAIRGIDENVLRLQNINLLAGPINALEYCTSMFKLPKPDKLLELYLLDR